MKRLSLPIILILVVLLGLGGVGKNPSAAAEEDHLIGHFLVATREMADPRFAESVIYMISHDRSGAMGLVVNRPVAEGPLSDLLKALGQKGESADATVRIHFGGPVESERLLILHSNDYAARATMFVGNGLGVSGDDDILRAIGRGQGPRQKLFIFGYAGWGPGQLEDEIKSGAWFTIPAETALIFDDQAETKWDRAVAKRKIKT